MSSSPDYRGDVAKRALLAGGTLMLLLMAGFAAIGLLILYILSGAE